MARSKKGSRSKKLSDAWLRKLRISKASDGAAFIRVKFDGDNEQKLALPAVVWDTVQTGLGVKVQPSGKMVWLVQLIFPGQSGQSRREIGGIYPTMTLEAARAKAAQWYRLVKQGDDPRDIEEAERQRKEAERRARALKEAQNFEALAERYITEHLGERRVKKGEREVLVYAKRRGADDAREIRKFLIPKWRDKPVTEVTPQDVKELIKPLARKTPAQAHIVLNHIKRIYSWALNDDTDYGLTASPAAVLKPEKLIGKKRVRTRVLSDDELFAYWRGAGRLGYPMGSLYRLIALTGVRKGEASGAQLPEFNMQDPLWTIPPERFKSEQEHLVPLSAAALALVDQIPRWNAGDFLFSTTGGEKPVNGFSKYKKRLDKFMLRTLRALARTRGEDADSVELAPFIIHDVRRTVRTRLSALKVDRNVAELVIGHGKKGLDRVYDQHEFLPEMREALERWSCELGRIVGEPMPEPNAPSKVVPIKGRKAAA